MKRTSDTITTCLSACLGLFVAACAGSDSDPGTDPDKEDVAYDEMSFGERAAYMDAVVLPHMKEIFVAFDAKFERMECKTCHGSGAANGTFAMPSAEVPPLPPPEEFEAYLEDPEHLRWTQFMADQVWPEMAKLLEQPTYDPETNPEGFSCSNCHTIKSGVN
ncbi:hypothetical protein [Chondromyces crocatus]|uniref:Cytochrome c domain-containing protein n=1 Tax=Chondromyces crocatus TaxID=52 RepID=A0A0K1E9X8_CHOCO|nr:hypothetical protein [Chondromyces crocatus]AKT37681.1 uncharacterized protein CMC5_018230 [Chondromyces crocatus]